jgi:hypothetical protein
MNDIAVYTTLELANTVATRVRRAYEASEITANEVVRNDIEVLLDLIQGKINMFVDEVNRCAVSKFNKNELMILEDNRTIIKTN